uniref:Uncharacterized protein n=1 Tax=Panagrolaimus sp. ES5 TaxID=591445 RepID=A0AC34GFA2_9BILA
MHSINEVFPSIKSLEINFEKWKGSTWQPIIAKMKEIKPQWFKDVIPTNIVGRIYFFVYIDELEDKELRRFEKAAGKYAGDIGRAARKFQIHENLRFEFGMRD